MIIDCHDHVYPAKIARKASAGIGSFYDLPMMTDDASPENLIRVGDRAGIDKFIIHSVATSPAQVRGINDFIINTVNDAHGRFLGFATTHPGFADHEAELSRAVEGGLIGLKLHPDFQKFHIYDTVMDPVYTFCQNNGIPILFHTGDHRYSYSDPRLIPRILDRFPDLKLICAHFGGWSQWKEAEEALADTNVMVDCSSSFFAMSDERIMELIRLFGPHRVLFGSDFPMWDPGEELKRLRNLPLAEKELDMILSGNATRFLGI